MLNANRVRFVVIWAVLAIAALLVTPVPAVSANSQGVTVSLSVDSTSVEEGSEVVATVTIRTNSARQPTAYLGGVRVTLTPGTAEQGDFISRGINSNTQAMCSVCFTAVRDGGSVTAYEIVYKVPIWAVDDGEAEGAETIDIGVELYNLLESSLVTLNSTTHTVTIQASQAEFSTTEAPARSYIEVEVEDHYVDSTSTTTSTFTVSWSDVDSCTGSYNAYLDKEVRRYSGTVFSRLSQLGTVSSTATTTEITKTIARLHTDTRDGFSNDASGYRVTLYCGTDSGREVSRAKIRSSYYPYRPYGATYSSQPKLSSLSVAPSTVSLRPSVSRYNHRYYAVVPHTVDEVTLNVTADTGYSIDYDDSDSNGSDPGHQVRLLEGSTSVYYLKVWKLLYTTSSGYRYYEPNYARYEIYFKRLSRPPAISGISSTNYNENGTAAVTTYSLSVAGATNVHWSLSGDDAGDFAISGSGVLTFSSPPNFENPRDHNQDNVYEVTIDVAYNYPVGENSISYATGSLGVTVTVANVNESPTLASQ